ncbi:Uma2 family endonuclease [Neolewinella agarilytica]|uniref:Endonuclease, Uma2 family (Restriction endonuclease fold) n=1 Tax=Neolewinella agarilytica TaxID=478744 RepID=A0A1H9MXM5_9BACT|nr:Uma2 family endonuclease [Neolewinella agarilytica]SER28442.1 Endonuclease, Uma2 family (restriction endonuclease fold) [Neolewinella agarilytica]
MGQPQLKNEKYTIEEWQKLEQSGDIRYEFHFGEVFAMAGGTINHGRISRNATTILDNHFNENDKNCEAFNSELKIEVKPNGQYVYPDTLAVCGEIKESDTVKGSIINPVLVIEVLSESSEAYDNGVKFRYYKKLPSLKEYFLIDQEKAIAILYRRNGTGDIFSRIDFEGLDAVIELESVDLTLPLSAFYRGVELTEESIG